MPKRNSEQWVGCTPEGFAELHQVIDLLRQENERLRIEAIKSEKFKAKYKHWYGRWARLKRRTST